MTILDSGSKENFLKEVAMIAIEKYAGKFNSLKIILPSGLACMHLQKIIVQKLGTCILPKIVPLSELAAESEDVFKIPSDQVGCITKLEEKIILAQTIFEYRPINYDYIQSLKLAPALSSLFFEFEANQIDIDNIRNLAQLDQAEHWYKIHDFLVFAFNQWKQKISDLKKTTPAAYQKIMLDSEFDRLQNNPAQNLLIAGTLGNNKITEDFIKRVIELKNCNFILPPHLSSDVYSVKKDKKTLLQQLITNINAADFNGKISHIEFENSFHEAEYIALACKNILKNNPESKIAIIADNNKTKECCSVFLDKYGLEYQDQFGKNMLDLKSVSFILTVAKQISLKFSLKKFFAFISHPLLNSKQSQEIKQIIRKKHKFANNLDEIMQILQVANKEELINYFTPIHKALSQKFTSGDFLFLCSRLIQVTEKILPDIWQNNQEIIEPLREICQLSVSFFIKNAEDFPEILQQALVGARIFSKIPEKQIIIDRATATTLINYDVIIIANLNESSYPRVNDLSNWINKSMAQSLGLVSAGEKIDEQLYEFYLNIQNNKVILTRSKKDLSNKNTMPSPFILSLGSMMKNKLDTQIGKVKFSDRTHALNSSTEAVAVTFPTSLYATDIETLVKAPYNFYAKKILNLRKIDEIDDSPKLSEFGSFFHLVVETYTKTYQALNRNKKDQLVAIIDSLLVQINIPLIYKKTWRAKLIALADEFIEFDESRRLHTSSVYSEIQGTIKLKLADHEIEIKAIADRIEVNKEGSATILDFKTGALPTEKDVLSGTAPQLIIEAIILAAGGFNINSTEIKELVYVKIGSRSPYIEVKTIQISAEFIQEHKKGLQKLLEHYIVNKKFPVEPNLMKYDDYKHLARRF